MALITTAAERLATQTSVKLVILGPAKIGKTSLAKTLDADKTLVIDMEAGMLALDDWAGDSISVREKAIEYGLHPWDFLRDFACLIAGPNPAVTDASKPYSKEHHDYVIKTYGSRADMIGKYDTLFFDSITDTSRLCFSWCKSQPEAFSDKKKDPKTGLAAYNGLGAYGLLGQQMVGADGFFNQLKHTPDKNLIFVGLLDKITDEYGHSEWKTQVEGSKTKLELAGIFDQIISFVDMDFDNVKHRVFVCQQQNPEGYPAGDRSGRLNMIEEPHMGKLLEKIKAGSRTTQYDHSLPAPAEPQSE